MTGTRLKIAVVSDYDFSTGGVEVFTQEFLRHTSDLLDATLVTWTSPESWTVPVPVVRIEHGDVQLLWSTLAAADVIMVIASFNLRALSWLAADYLAAEAKRAITVVQTSQHSSPTFFAVEAQLERFRSLVRLSSATVAVSDDVATSLSELVGESRDFTVIENAARPLPKTLSGVERTRGRMRVSFIGRPHPQKGFAHFQRLASELAGTGLRFAANTVSIECPPDGRISYSANLSDEELREFFDETDLLVTPYLRADGLPLALLEALNCGVPVIGYDSPGVGMLLRRYSQMVVPPKYDALLDAVLAWRDGGVTVPPPSINDVAPWEYSIAKYVDLLFDVAGSPRD